MFIVSLFAASISPANEPGVLFPFTFACVGVGVGIGDVEVLLLLDSIRVALSSLALPPRSAHALDTPHEATFAGEGDPSMRGQLTPNSGASGADGRQLLLLVVGGDADADEDDAETTTETATMQ
jgi:hypothetical protein